MTVDPTPPDEGWEARMSQRAAARRAAGLSPPEWVDEAREAWLAEATADRRKRLAAMTLAGATDLLGAPPWGCACIGDPYCCRHAFTQARRLQRAAHIVARLLADAAARSDGSAPN